MLRALGDLISVLSRRDIHEGALRLDTALNNISQGLCFFDDAQRLMLCNRRYIEMYDLPPERVRFGTTLREIVDLRVAAGSGPKMSAAEYIAVTRSDKPQTSTVELQNGRTFTIHHRPMPNGGWVATHED